MRSRTCAVLAASLMALAGCASVPMGDIKKDAELKTFSPKADVALIYVYRNEFLLAAQRMYVEIDGRPLGQTAVKTYLVAEVSPGRHIVTSVLFERADSLEIEAVAGKLYYVWQEVKLGWEYPRTRLHLVSEEEGRKGVLECQLAEGQ